MSGKYMSTKHDGKMQCPVCGGKGSIHEDADEYSFVTRDPDTNICLTCQGTGRVGPQKKLPNGKACWQIVRNVHGTVNVDKKHKILTETGNEPGNDSIKPLLADAREGDLVLVQYSDGNKNYDQIIAANGPIVRIAGKIFNYDLQGRCLPLELNDTHALTEWQRLEKEGTAEWALQMWKLKKSLIHPESGDCFTAEYSNAERVIASHPTGWQLYNKLKHAKEQLQADSISEAEQQLIVQLRNRPAIMEVLTSGKKVIIVPEDCPVYMDCAEIYRSYQQKRGTWMQQDEEEFTALLLKQYKRLKEAHNG